MSAPTLPENNYPTGDELPETVISCDGRVRFIQAIRDLWIYRDLFLAFITRDIKVRYKQTMLGVVWVILQPLLAGGVFSVVFRNLGAMQETSATDLLLFHIAGLVPWTTFSTAVTTSSASLETNANLISKVFFPRLVVPGAYVCGSVVDFSIAFTVLMILAAATGKFSPLLILAMPFLLAVQLMAAAGIGLIFSILNAQYRDVKYVIPFALMLGLFVTVPASLDSWKQPLLREILSFNPMAAPIETYRAILTDRPVDWSLLGKGTTSALTLLLAGIWFFRRREARLVDIL